jgi:MazG family protein
MDRRMAAVEALQKIVERLRGPGGCPWDREQTLGKMARYLVEEASEAADAIEDGGGNPSPAVCEELGDVMMNVLLAAQIAAELGAFSLAEVAEGITAKLIRRHPHVFGEAKVTGTEEVLQRWNDIKEREKAAAAREPRSRLDSVPRGLPPLLRAYKLGERAAEAGFDWPDASGALEKVVEELAEVRAALAGEDRAAREEELGDLLFAVANLCRKLEVRPDEALRRTLRKFCARFRHIEERLPALENATLGELETLWQEAKAPTGEGKRLSGAEAEA